MALSGPLLVAIPIALLAGLSPIRGTLRAALGADLAGILAGRDQVHLRAHGHFCDSPACVRPVDTGLPVSVTNLTSSSRPASTETAEIRRETFSVPDFPLSTALDLAELLCQVRVTLGLRQFSPPTHKPGG